MIVGLSSRECIVFDTPEEGRSWTHSGTKRKLYEINGRGLGPWYTSKHLIERCVKGGVLLTYSQARPRRAR